MTAFLSVLILGSSLAALATAYAGLKSAEILADESLKNLALSLTRAVETAGREAGGLAGNRTLLIRVLSDDLVAFAQITDPEGRIRFHTNPDLEGRTASLPDGKPTARRTLGTGETVLEVLSPVLLPEGSYLLDLHLRTVNADRITARARAALVSVVAVVFLLWGLGAIGLALLVRQRRAERIFRQREHLALIGQMSAVLAHELRNALGSIKGYAQYLDEKMDASSPAKTATGTIVAESLRIESLVSDLLAYSRPLEVRTKEVSLDNVLRIGEQCLEGRNIVIERKGTDDPIVLRTDEDRLVTVIRNVFLNAAEAMNDSGRILVRIRKGRHRAHIHILDEGPGIADEDIDRIFLPFFTTKTRGTGLGLAYSRKVMEALGGGIEIRNRTDRPDAKGAQVTLTLPI